MPKRGKIRFLRYLMSTHFLCRFATSGRGSAISIWEVSGDGGAPARKTTLKGHASSVTAVHLSGQELVTADKDGVLKLWRPDSSSAAALATVRAHDKEINCLDGVSSSSSLVLSGSQDKTAKLWSVASSSALQLLATLRGHRRAVTCTAFSQHEDVMATGSSDLTIRY